MHKYTLSDMKLRVEGYMYVYIYIYIHEYCNNTVTI